MSGPIFKNPNKLYNLLGFLIFFYIFYLMFLNVEYSFSEKNFIVSDKRNAEVNSGLIEAMCSGRGGIFCACFVEKIYKETSEIDRAIIYINSKNIFFKNFYWIKMKSAIVEVGYSREFSEKIKRDAENIALYIVSQCKISSQ